jgi:phage terminase large subunit-like protein
MKKSTLKVNSPKKAQKGVWFDQTPPKTLLFIYISSITKNEAKEKTIYETISHMVFYQGNLSNNN